MMNKILVVNDDRIIGEMLEFMPGSKGFLAVVYNKPEQTVHNMFHNDIDLVILDQFLLGVSEIKVCMELHENETTVQKPLIMISGHSTVKKMFDGRGYRFCIQAL